MKYTSSLKGSVNFKRVLKQGNYNFSENITMYVKKIPNQDNINLLGICVSKKHGNSVIRNKLKRWAKEAYYIYENKLDKNYSIIILYKKGIDINKLSFDIVKDEIKTLFIKNEMLHE